MTDPVISHPSPVPDTRKINLALSRLEKVILDSIDFAQVIQKIVDSVFYELDYLQLGYRIVVLALIDEEKQVLKRISISRTSKAEIGIAALPYSFDQLEIPLTASRNYSIRAMQDKKPYITHDWTDILTPPLSEQEAKAIQQQAAIQTSMIYPLVVHEKSIGSMIFSMVKSEAEVLEEEKELLLRFTDIVGLAVQNAKLYSSLQQANERLQSLDKLKDEFVSLASHELRTPLTAIKSYAWSLREQRVGTLNQKQQEYAGIIFTSTERLIRLVKDMLDVSRIEAGHMTMHPQPIQLVDVASEVLGEVRPTAQAQGISLTILHLEMPLPMVLADTDRIKEVMVNLTGNALKFTPSGGQITISFEQKGDMVLTRVADTGTGIKAEDMPKLFHKFGMIEGNYLTPAVGQGTGLGLYLSKSIIELQGGELSVFSEGENKGTTFTFSLKKAPDIPREQEHR